MLLNATTTLQERMTWKDNQCWRYWS